MLFCVAFLFQFLIAGLTGVTLAVAPLDWQLSNSYYVVAHFHYVIVGGILFTCSAAFYYWFPKISGRMYSEALGKTALLALSHRLSSDIRFHAYSGDSRNAAQDLHL